MSDSVYTVATCASRHKPVWAYASAAILVLALIAGGLVRLGQKARDGDMVAHRKPVPIVQHPEEVPSQLGSDTTNLPKPDPGKTAEVPKSAPTRHPRRGPAMANSLPVGKHGLAQRQNRVPGPSVSPPDDGWQDTASLPAESPPLAVVAVTWHSGDQVANSYAYVEKDSQTGLVTTCRAERSADSIKIHIEIEQEGDGPAGEGAEDHEKGSRIHTDDCRVVRTAGICGGNYV